MTQPVSEPIRDRKERTRAFARWLGSQSYPFGWSFRDLAHRSGLSAGALSQALNNGAGPTWELCARLGRALRLSPTTVFRRAGLLPPQPESRDEALAEMLETLAMLPEGPIRDEATQAIQAIARDARRRAQGVEQG